MRRLTRLLLVTLMLSFTLTQAPTVAAATTCGQHTFAYQWWVELYKDNTLHLYNGTYNLTGYGCWNGSTSWGTAVAWTMGSGNTPTFVSGPGYYADEKGITIFWDNLSKTLTVGSSWCRINMFPRIQLTKYGAWSKTGTNYSISQDNIFTNCTGTFMS